MNKQTIYFFVILSAVLAGCSKSPKNTDIPDSSPIKKAFREKVEVVRAELSAQQEELILAGTVECDPDKVMNYAPLVSGVVEKTCFMLGDKVTKGQVMLDLRSPELSSLQSESVIQQAEIKIAQRNLTSIKEMYKEGMVSDKELLEAEGRLGQALAASSKVRSDMAVFGINKGGGIFSVKAPVSGYVVEKNVSSGSTVSEGSAPLFTIADLSTVWIMANVYANNLQFVREGMPVEITSLSYPDEVFTGMINTVSPVFDPEEKVVKARIVMLNKELRLKPHMAVMVKVIDRKTLQLISILSGALIFDRNKYFVVVEQTPGKYEAREVKLRGHHDSLTYIASGLQAGEKVVVSNQLLIYSGLKEK